jgi:hypothetical protein
MIRRLPAAKEEQMRRFGVVASVLAALFVALPGIAAAEPTKNVLPVELTCGGETFNIVAPGGGTSSAALFVNSRSVAVLQGVNGVLTPGFSEDDLTTCTAVLPDGESFTAHVLITPRR